MSEPAAVYVYILGDHGESGTTNAIATLDRSRLPAMLEDWYVELLREGNYVDLTDERAKDVAGLQRVLAQSDADLAASSHPHPLSHGWGGIILTVARLV